MKKVICILFVVCLLVCGCSKMDSKESGSDFDIDAYKQSITACVNSAYDNAIYIGNVAQYQYNYMKSMEKFSSSASSDILMSRGFEWLEKETGVKKSEIESKYEKNTESYKDILFTEIDGAEAEAIKKEFEEFFDGYIELYNLVISPSNNKDVFLDSYNESIDSILDGKEKLDILLK